LAATSAQADLQQTPRVAVIIPYYQRQAGLLRRALSSVAAQEYRPVQVVVVDDGSPCSAADEISPQLRDALPGLTVVRQVNRGVAAARNASLALLRDDVAAVALLDSDDYWTPSHLRHAATALALGADFFFSNSLREGETTDYYRAHPRRELLCQSQPVAGTAPIKRWSASISALFGAGCVFETASVVFRRSVFPQLRFSSRFRRAGEDQAAFWELLTRSSLILYCTDPTLISGKEGFGTWRNATLGSAAHLVRLADEIHLRRHVMSHFPVRADDRELMQQAIEARRGQALYSALHLLRRRREHTVREILYLMRTDPASAAFWCAHLPQLMYRRLRKRKGSG
jgi:succinoglycan biosynthesis protein ExoW